MVGVPGKSKGCLTCRQRKIACSLEKPKCARCVKSNRECGGYQRDAIFVVDEATGEKVQDPSKSHVKTYRRQKPGVHGTRKPAVLPKSTNSSSSSTNPVEFPPGIEITSPAAFRQQFFCQFLSTFVPDVNEAATKLKIRAESTTWLVLVPEIPELTKALDTAILALSTARLGRSNNDQRLIMESRKIYGEGLRDLQRALWNPDLMYRDETLAACMALGMYETLECPADSRGGWVSHSGGCSRLIQLRGPKAHADSLGHHLFSSYRLTGIVECIHHRRASYLSQPEWTRIAWRGRTTGTLDQLLDILSYLPSLFEASDLISTPTLQDIPALLSILDRLWKMDADLKQFFQDFENATEGPISWPTLSTINLLDDEEGENLFPVAFHYHSLADAFTNMMYWLNQILCYRTMMEVSRKIQTAASQIPRPKAAPSSQAQTQTQIPPQPQQQIPAIKSEPSTSHPSPASHSSSHSSSSAAPPPPTTTTTSSSSTTPSKNPPTNSPPPPFNPQSQTLLARLSTLPPLPPITILPELARNICQTYEFCMSPDKLSQGPGSLLVPMLMAALVFKHFPGCERELRWARRGMREVSGRGWRIGVWLEPR